MIASFHLVTFRRPRLLLGGGRPAAAPGLRFWKALSTARDSFLAPEMSYLGLLQPNLREWGFFAVWESEADADRFLTASALVETWRGAGSELWSVLLKPSYARGEWSGVRALAATRNGVPQAPAAFITRLDLSFRAARAMWLSAVRRIAPQMRSVDGLLVGIPLMGRPYLEPMTFSVWRSAEDARSFAYRGPAHPQAVRQMRKSGAPLRFSAACFYPYRSEGTWKGADPLASANLDDKDARGAGACLHSARTVATGSPPPPGRSSTGRSPRARHRSATSTPGAGPPERRPPDHPV